MSARVREYRADDEHEVVSLWNQCLPRDEISLTVFRRKVVLDPNLQAGGCLVGVDGGHVAAFLLALRRRYPYYDLGLEPGKGWITMFFVHPGYRRQGIMTAMLAQAEAFLAKNGVRGISVSNYTPNYFIPGVDLDAYEAAHAFLKSRGYRKTQNVYGMGRSLIDFSIPPEMEALRRKLGESGCDVGVFRPSQALKVLDFLREHYPGDLYRVALEAITENPDCDEILVATRNGEVVGFSHFRDEHFGPFAIHPEYTGRGLGPLLYYQTVQQMRKKGKKNLWLAWTTGRAKDFYHRVGLKVLRRHVIMEKQVEGDRQ